MRQEPEFLRQPDCSIAQASEEILRVLRAEQSSPTGTHPELLQLLNSFDTWWGACSCCVRSDALAGRMVVVRRFLGLKPRAESCSPSGALELPNIP